MNSATMEIKIDDNSFNHTNNEDDDALSLRAFQLYDQTATSSNRSSPRTSSAEDLFEFLPNLPKPTATGDIVFCGKVISGSVHDCNNDRLNDDNQLLNRDCLMLVGSSARLNDRRPIEHVIPMRSVSVGDLRSPHNDVKNSTSVKKVIHVMPSKSKRRIFMCGPVNSMPEMEMSSIRERQLRRPPSRMFSMTEAFDATQTKSGPVAKAGDATRTVSGPVEEAVNMTHDHIRSGEIMKLSVADAGRHKNRLSSVIVRSLACLRI